METNENQVFRFGVYGIILSEGKVLMIKKGRGPYMGLYDLPGGGIEFGETIEDTLKRELNEEVGAEVTSFEFFGFNQYFTKYLNTKNPDRDFHHLGAYYKVECKIDNLKTTPDGQDSLGAVFVNIEDLNHENCSPIALPMILKCK